MVCSGTTTAIVPALSVECVANSSALYTGYACRTLLVYSSIFTFLIDAYPMYAASALAANSCYAVVLWSGFPAIWNSKSVNRTFGATDISIFPLFRVYVHFPASPY